MQISPGDGDSFIFISRPNHHQVSEIEIIFHISQYVCDLMKEKSILGLKTSNANIGKQQHTVLCKNNEPISTNSIKIWQKVAKNSEISKDTKLEQIFHELSKLEITALLAKNNTKFEQAAFQNFSQSRIFEEQFDFSIE